MRSCFTKQEDSHVDEMLIPVTDNQLPSYQDKHHVNNYIALLHGTWTGHVHSSLQIEDCILAILDSTVDRTHAVIHYDLLEADKNGYTPDQYKGYNSKGYNPSGHNCIEIVAKQDLEVSSWQ